MCGAKPWAAHALLKAPKLIISTSWKTVYNKSRSMAIQTKYACKLGNGQLRFSLLALQRKSLAACKLQGMWRRRWDSNPRDLLQPNAFRVRPVMTASIRLHKWRNGQCSVYKMPKKMSREKAAHPPQKPFSSLLFPCNPQNILSLPARFAPCTPFPFVI